MRRVDDDLKNGLQQCLELARPRRDQLVTQAFANASIIAAERHELRITNPGKSGVIGFGCRSRCRWFQLHHSLQEKVRRLSRFRRNINNLNAEHGILRPFGLCPFLPNEVIDTRSTNLV